MRNLKACDLKKLSLNNSLLNDLSITKSDFLYQTNAIDINYNLSVVEHDDNGNIIGALIFGNYDITYGTPILTINRNKALKLCGKKGINGYMFYIDKNYRGKGIDKKMILYAYSKIKEENYDYIWIGVAKDLKSHKYWCRKGFKKLFDYLDEATFYIYIIKE